MELVVRMWTQGLAPRLILMFGLFMSSSCQLRLIGNFPSSNDGSNDHLAPAALSASASASSTAAGSIVTIHASGGTTPYSLQVLDGFATLSGDTISSDVPVTVHIRVTDSRGESRDVEVDFTGNVSLASGFNSFVTNSSLDAIYYLKPDGGGINEIYRTDPALANSSRIFSSTTAVSAITGIHATDLQVTSDGQQVGFMGLSGGVRRLYMISGSGASPNQVNGPIAESGQSVQDFKIAGSRVVYRDGEQETGADVEQWMRTVNRDGTDRKLVTPNYGGNGDSQQVTQFKYSKDLTKVFFFTAETFMGDTHLYAANTDGSSNASWLQVSPAGVDFWVGQSLGIAASDDNSRVSIATFSGSFTNYICKADGTGCITYANFFPSSAFTSDGSYSIALNLTDSKYYLLNSAAAQSVQVPSSTFFIPGSSDMFSTQTTAGQTNLYSAPISTAGAPVWTQLNAALPASGSIISYAVSPDNTKLHYLADDLVDAVYRLHVMALDGSGAVHYSGTEIHLTTPADAIPRIQKISSDGTKVLLLSISDSEGQKDLYLANLAHNTIAQLTNRAQASANISQISASDDLGRIIYTSNQNTLGTYEAFRIFF